MSDDAQGKQKIMALIQKLLALAADPANEHEAAAAAEKARELLDKYNLAVGEIELKARKSVEVEILCSRNPDVWFITLSNLVCKLFATESILVTGLYSRMVICGLAQNVQVAEMTLRYLVSAINALVRARGTQLRKKGKRSVPANARRVNSFRRGAACRIEVESRKVAQPVAEALVLIGNAIARRHIAEHYPGLKTTTRRTKADGNFIMGYHDGKTVNVYGARKQLASGSTGTPAGGADTDTPTSRGGTEAGQ